MTDDNSPIGVNARHDTRQTLSVWRTRADMCRVLSCSLRTLQRKVVTGKVERRKEGRRGLYRLTPEKRAKRAITAPKRATKKHDTRHDNTRHAPNDGALRVLMERLEEQAVRLAKQEEELTLARAQAARFERECGLWEARARRWRRALKERWQQAEP